MEVRRSLSDLYTGSGCLPMLPGYPLSPRVLTPFAQNELVVDGDRRRRFNHLISHARVLIECAFGHLKNRFPSLMRMGAVSDMDDLYRSVEAMLILHNMCYDLHDTVSGQPDSFTRARLEEEDGELYDYVGQEHEDNDWGEGIDVNEPLLEAGRAFREECMNLICPDY